MVNEIFLVVGNCDTAVYQDIKQRIEEKLSAADETAVRFVSFEEFVQYPYDQVEKLREGVRRGMTGVDLTAVNVVVLFGNDRFSNEELLGSAKDLRVSVERLREALDQDGTRNRLFHLIWMVQDRMDQPKDYRSVYSMLYADPETKEGYNGRAFDYLYLLSDKRSNLTIDSSSRVDGAALLLTMLLLADRKNNSGIYTAGVGRRSISGAEVRHYAEDAIAKALSEGSTKHRDRSEEICTAALGIGTLEDNVYSAINSSISSEFCLVTGENGENQAEPYPIEGASEAILDDWSEKVIESVSVTPFAAMDMLRYLDALEERQGKIESNINSMIAADAAQLSSGFFDSKEKKQLVAAYNQFVLKRKTAQLSMLHVFFRLWLKKSREVRRTVQEKNDQLQMLLEKHRADESFIDKCRLQAEAVVEKVNRKIATLEYERFETVEHYDEANAETSLKNLLNDMVGIVTTNVDDEALIKDIRATETPVQAQILQDIHQQCSNLMASLGHGQQFNMAAAKTFFFVPGTIRSVLEKVAQDVLRVPNAQTIGAEDHRFQNLEALMLVQIDNPGNLTVFSARSFGRAPLVRSYQGNQSSGNPAQTSSTGQEDERMEAGENRNPWDLMVNGGLLQMNWRNPDVSTVSCQINGERGTNHVAIQRAQYNLKGSWDISPYIGYGLHTIRLITQGKMVSEYDFIGCRHLINISCVEADYMMNDNRQLYKFTLTVDSVDGDSTNQADSILCQNLILQTESGQLKMPLPEIRKKKQQWTIYREKDEIPQLFPVNQSENSYSVVVG